MFDLDSIADSLAAAIRNAAERADIEQSPLGVDALDELSIHPLLHAALRDAGFGIHPEQRYPGDRLKSRRSEGERCDIVLTESPTDHLLDPLSAGTLFAHRGVAPDEALWLEVKVIGQFSVYDGVGRPNPQYSGRLLGEVMRGAHKLAADHGIAHAALTLILFNADEATATHDLEAWMNRALEKSVPISWPSLRRFAITDRIGNAQCTVAVMKVNRL
ncbi:MAG TPA: hypothetical protein VG797_02275 [Phycisphaerales bacterium]|nr:hypothetical protein [Phycisphaerales bacterium]